MHYCNKHVELTSIAVCICTRQRPIMLGKCLEKMLSLEIANKCHIEILVIENDNKPLSMKIVNSYNSMSDMQIHYFLENNIGIAAARNRSVEEALKLEAEWIAFIDDDAYPEKKWLEEYVICIHSHAADVYDGRYVLEYPKSTPDYLQIQPHVGIEAEQLKFASTGNVLFHRKLVASNGLKLRFNTEFNFCGGEDYELFRRASSYGITIRRSTKAIVYETVADSRATLTWNLARRFHHGQVNSIVSLLHNGLSYTIIRKTVLGILKIFSGTVGLPLFPLFPFSFYSRRYVYKSMCRISYGVGLFAGLLKFTNQTYRQTDGM